MSTDRTYPPGQERADYWIAVAFFSLCAALEIALIAAVLPW
jgi:hypothetical protein